MGMTVLVRTSRDRQPLWDRQPVLRTKGTCLSCLSRLYIGTRTGRLVTIQPTVARFTDKQTVGQAQLDWS